MDFEKKHQEDLQRLRGFRLLDDDFMTKVFEDIQCAELLLRIILNDEGIHVLEVHSQRGIKNLQARSVVIPGSRKKQFPAGEYEVPCALIIGKRKASTDLKTSLNSALREFDVPV